MQSNQFRLFQVVNRHFRAGLDELRDVFRAFLNLGYRVARVVFGHCPYTYRSSRRHLEFVIGEHRSKVADADKFSGFHFV
jgi:5-formaminoimidazole-4-carboxamide-1-beta-D-ribofuranosyl 5'-monophosphate synthetase